MHARTHALRPCLKLLLVSREGLVSTENENMTKEGSEEAIKATSPLIWLVCQTLKCFQCLFFVF